VPAAQAEAWKDRYLSDDGRFDDREVRA
jgi:hypothetical protein